MIRLVPIQGRILEHGEQKTISTEEIIIGDTLRVFSGEIISADGIIIKWNILVDQAVITGESLPVDKA